MIIGINIFGLSVDAARQLIIAAVIGTKIAIFVVGVVRMAARRSSLPLAVLLRIFVLFRLGAASPFLSFVFLARLRLSLEKVWSKGGPKVALCSCITRFNFSNLSA